MTPPRSSRSIRVRTKTTRRFRRRADQSRQLAAEVTNGQADGFRRSASCIRAPGRLSIASPRVVFTRERRSPSSPALEQETSTISLPGSLPAIWASIFRGNPDIIVQNMAGAASMIAANHLYNVSKPDGLTIGAIFPALLLRSAHRTRRGQVRLEQVHLARQPGKIRPASLHARGFPLQIH